MVFNLLVVLSFHNKVWDIVFCWLQSLKLGLYFLTTISFLKLVLTKRFPIWYSSSKTTKYCTNRTRNYPHCWTGWACSTTTITSVWSAPRTGTTWASSTSSSSSLGLRNDDEGEDEKKKQKCFIYRRTHEYSFVIIILSIIHSKLL